MKRACVLVFGGDHELGTVLLYGEYKEKKKIQLYNSMNMKEKEPGAWFFEPYPYILNGFDYSSF